MNEKIGIIDLGSNTTRLIVMSYQPQHSFRLIDEVRETVRLAEGVGDDGLLQPAAIYRAVGALKMFHALCKSTNVQTVVAVGTSAVRDATNQADFLRLLKHETDLDLRILSEEEEAYYAYLGVVNSMPITDGFVIDVGGGSAEIAEVRDRQFTNWASKPAGVVRFTERYVHSDPISNKDYRALNQAAEEVFAHIPWISGAPGGMLVGVGGTVRNLARIDQKRNRYPIERLHGSVLTRKALENIMGTLRKKNVSERGSISGLNRDRADVILAGAVIIHQMMQQGNFDAIHISGQGLRDGLFYEHFLRHQETPLFENVREFSIHNLARLYNYEPTHVAKVRELSLSLFDKLQPLHSYGAWERELLGYAALLHDIGIQVGYYDHHKHSAYLLANTTLPGFSHREIAILTVLVRSHRKGDVKTGEYSAVLHEDDTERLARLGGILRMAEDLERSKSQVVRDVDIEFEDDTIRLRLLSNQDTTIEIWNANRRNSLLQKAFGRTVDIVGESNGD